MDTVAANNPFMTQTAGEVIHKVQKTSTQNIPIADVLWEGRFRADGLGFAMGHDRAIIQPVRQLPDVPTHFAESVAQGTFGQGGYLAYRANAKVMKALFSFLPSPQIRLTGNGARNSVTLSGPNHESIRLPDVASQLRKVLFGATPTEATKPVSVRIRFLICRAISGAGPNNPSQPCTSRNASSKLNGSTSGVNERKIARICLLISA
jgi:hypothetical protein